MHCIGRRAFDNGSNPGYTSARLVLKLRVQTANKLRGAAPCKTYRQFLHLSRLAAAGQSNWKAAHMRRTPSTASCHRPDSRRMLHTHVSAQIKQAPLVFGDLLNMPLYSMLHHVTTCRILVCRALTLAQCATSGMTEARSPFRLYLWFACAAKQGQGHCCSCATALFVRSTAACRRDLRTFLSPGALARVTDG